MVYNNVSVPSLEGVKTLVNSFPRVLHLLLLFSLGFIYSKKLVFLLASEGKKWSFYICSNHIGGKKWGKMLLYVGSKVCQGIIPHAKLP